MLRRWLYVILCCALMYAFLRGVGWLVTGISADFGHGFFVGVALTVVLIYIAQRVEGKRFLDR